MMDRTDRHYRYFLRQLSRHTLNYTEMVTTGAILHGDRDRLLAFDPVERPVALQLGGDDPQALATCARIAADLGYDEINLNIGCPSDRVQRGRIGACLMAEPTVVADAVAAMRKAVSVPVTVKHRVGIDGRERFEDMLDFVDTVDQAGCDRFAVHARIAVLAGLSPKQNRNVPPLRYDDVYRLKRERPSLRIEINGGITSLDATLGHLKHVDGVMIGRAAWDDPYLFANADRRIFDDASPNHSPSRREVVESMLPYIARELANGETLPRLVKPMLALFNGQAGARAWRRTLSEESRCAGAGVEVVEAALSRIPSSVQTSRASETIDHQYIKASTDSAYPKSTSISSPTTRNA